MSGLTKVSPYRSGPPRFGTRQYVFDNSVKTYQLSKEQIQEYLNGRPLEEIVKEQEEKKMSQPKVISYIKYLEVEAERDELKKQLEEMKANTTVNNNNEEIERLKREIIDAHKLVSEKEEEIARLQELFETAMSDKEQLHKEVIILENQLQRLREVNDELKERNESYFSQLSRLDQEVRGLRLYALQKLQVDVFGEGLGST
jgi:predicted RNase H-like nuclease (RuvC/YqgF family)